MADKSMVEKAGETIGVGIEMASDLAGAIKSAVTNVTKALKNAPATKAVEKAANKVITKKAAKKAPATKAAKAPAKKTATKKAAKKAPAKKAAAKATAKKAPAKKAAKKAGRTRR